MKYRAICPVCNARVSRMSGFGTKAKCRACGAMLRENAKWGWIGTGIVSLFIILPLILATFEPAFLFAALVMTIVVFLVSLLLWPYVSKYEIDPKHDKSKEKT